MRKMLISASALLLAGCASAPAEVVALPAAPAETARPPAQLQYLYGSPEAAVRTSASTLEDSVQPLKKRMAEIMSALGRHRMLGSVPEQTIWERGAARSQIPI